MMSVKKSGTAIVEFASPYAAVSIQGAGFETEGLYCISSAIRLRFFPSKTVPEI